MKICILEYVICAAKLSMVNLQNAEIMEKFNYLQ